MSGDGERPIPSGNAALDLLNTLHLGDRGPADLIRTPAGLVGWLEAARRTEDPGAPGGDLSHPDRRSLLTEAHRLRADIRALVESFSRGGAPPPGALHGINRVLEASRTSRRLEPRPGGFLLSERERSTAPLARLAPFALAAAELLLQADPGRIRRCAGDGCATWFLDTSKGGRRRWCSMGRCGNRAKAARHRRRDRGRLSEGG